jgi:hypothetical protein
MSVHLGALFVTGFWVARSPKEAIEYHDLS